MHLENNYISYNDALESLKAICLGPSENIAIAEAIRRKFVRSSIRMLDVGTGDGTSCVKVAAALARHNISTSALGIDVRNQKEPPATPANVNYEFHCADYTTFPTNEVFDVILFRQSIYYLGSVEDAIEKCRPMLSAGGIVVVICWSKECIFRRIVELVDPANPALALGAEAIQHAAETQAFSIVGSYPFTAQVDISHARAEPESLLLPLEVLLRGRHVLQIDCGPLEVFLKQGCGDLEYRCNSIVLLQDNA